jgi:hypothetical protein
MQQRSIGRAKSAKEAGDGATMESVAPASHKTAANLYAR